MRLAITSYHESRRRTNPTYDNRPTQCPEKDAYTLTTSKDVSAVFLYITPIFLEGFDTFFRSWRLRAFHGTDLYGLCWDAMWALGVRWQGVDGLGGDLLEESSGMCDLGGGDHIGACCSWGTWCCDC